MSASAATTPGETVAMPLARGGRRAVLAAALLAASIGRGAAPGVFSRACLGWGAAPGVLLLAGLGWSAPAARAQDGAKRTDAPASPGAAPQNEKLLEVAFRFRHEGNFDAAAAAFDAALQLLNDPAEKRVVLREAYDLALAQGNPDKAARLVRGSDLALEAAALARAGKAGEGLERARAAKDALVEGRMLFALGKADEALAAFTRAGAPAALERGELLLRLGRPADASQAFADAGDQLRHAIALERAKDGGASFAFEAAKPEGKARLDSLIERTREAKATYEKASAPVPRERARFALADLYGKLVDAYERLTIAHEKTNARADARALAELAARFAKAEVETTTDQGTDKLGLVLVAQRQLEARQKRLDERAAQLR